MVRQVTLIQKSHILVIQAREKALAKGLRGWLWWNWQIKVVGYGLIVFSWLVEHLAGRIGFYMIFDFLGDRGSLIVDVEDIKSEGK